jgi:AcrR family transcriptional regulator
MVAATQLFYKHGISGMSVDKIIAAAGTSKMGLYYHFSSKEELACAFLEMHHQEWMRRFRQFLADSANPRLPIVADALALWFHAPDFRGCAFINAVAEGASPALQCICVAHKAELLAELARLLPESAPHSAAAQALTVVEGMIVRFQMTHDDRVVSEGKELLRIIVST